MSLMHKNIRAMGQHYAINITKEILRQGANKGHGEFFIKLLCKLGNFLHKVSYNHHFITMDNQYEKITYNQNI